MPTLAEDVEWLRMRAKSCEEGAATLADDAELKARWRANAEQYSFIAARLEATATVSENDIDDAARAVWRSRRSGWTWDALVADAERGNAHCAERVAEVRREVREALETVFEARLLRT